MPNDPALASDTCIFLEAVTGDGGVHDSSGVWWLSPDIKLTGPTSGADKADPGVANPVSITVHRKLDADCTLTPGTESLTVEVWVGNPSLAMTPDNPASTTLIQSIGMPLPRSAKPRPQMSDRALLPRPARAECEKLLRAGRPARRAAQHLHRPLRRQRGGAHTSTLRSQYLDGERARRQGRDCPPARRLRSKTQ